MVRKNPNHSLTGPGREGPLLFSILRKMERDVSLSAHFCAALPQRCMHRWHKLSAWICSDMEAAHISPGLGEDVNLCS